VDALVRAALVVRGICGPINATLIGLCDRALETLPADEDVGRARALSQRTLAAGVVLGFAEVERRSTEALRLAQRSGDPLALSDALRARQHAASGTDGVTEPLELARRMIALPALGGPADAELWGTLWRIDAALQLGAIDVVDEELGRVELLAERLHWPIAHWHHHRLSAARAVLTGRFAQAEAEADTALAWAKQTEDLSAVAIDDPFRSELRHMQGGHDEMIDRFRTLQREDAWSGPILREMLW
jgi:hypothetical protein